MRRFVLEEVAIPEPNTGCWLFDGSINPGGYGQIKRNGKTRGAHRVSHEECIGPIPDGMLVCHRCDTPACINPQHLFLGTAADNMRDRDAKGRAATGSRNGAYTCPESVPRGDRHGFRLHPEAIARGDRNGSRLHPESRPRGSNHRRAKLDEERVRAIRARVAMGASRASIARELRMDWSTINAIVERTIWKHVA